MGNWTKVEKEPTSEQIFEENITRNELYDPKLIMNSKQLEEKAEEDLDFDEDDFMKEYRAKRMAQMQEETKLPTFGKVLEINKQQWEEHVTRAPKDVAVVIHLYQN
jgi:hypothetical protein